MRRNLLWVTQSEAAVRLGVSLRTLARRISAGEVTTKREGRNVLVHVAEAQAVLPAECDDEEIIAVSSNDEAALKMPTRRPDEQPNTLELLGSMRGAFEMANGRADRAEERAIRYSRNAVMTGLVSVSLMVGTLALVAGLYHRQKLSASETIFELKTTHAVKLATRQAAIDRLKDDLATMASSLEDWRQKAGMGRRRLDAAIDAQDRTAVERDGLLAQNARLRSIVAKLEETEHIKSLVRDAWQALLGARPAAPRDAMNALAHQDRKLAGEQLAEPVVRGVRVHPATRDFD